MKKIVILGSSAVSKSLIEGLRESQFESEITLIAFDGHYPNRRDMYAPLIAKEISPEKVFCSAKDFFERNNIRVILDKKVSRINLNRKKIFTEEKEQIDYDILVITDTQENRFPDIKGTGKTGVFGYKKLKDVDQMIGAMPLIDSVAIQSTSFTGFQLAAAFHKREKEVILALPKGNFLSRCFDQEASQWLVRQFTEKGMLVLKDSSIAEILGDKDVKAVSIQPGKVYAAQTVVFAEMDEDLRLFSGSELQLDKKIKVNSHFQTNVEGVFAVDQACLMDEEKILKEPVTSQLVLDVQGKTVASAITGQPYQSEASVLAWDLDIDGLTISIIGDVGEVDGVAVRKVFDQEVGTYQGLYMKNGCLVGAILVNLNSEKKIMMEKIKNQTSFEEDEARGHQISAPQTPAEDTSTELIDN